MDSWVPGSLDPLGPLHLPAGDHLVLNILLEGPDHKEEVGAKHPPEDAADDVHDVEADGGPQDVQDLKDEIHYSQVDPRPHEADVPLMYKLYWYAQSTEYSDVSRMCQDNWFPNFMWLREAAPKKF